MKRLEGDGLPEEPLAAAGLFHQNWLDPIERALAGGQDVLVVLEPASYEHGEWRSAAAAMLARKHARKLRLISVLLFAFVPVLCCWLAWMFQDAATPVLPGFEARQGFVF